MGSQPEGREEDMSEKMMVEGLKSKVMEDWNMQNLLLQHLRSSFKSKRPQLILTATLSLSLSLFECQNHFINMLWQHVSLACYRASLEREKPIYYVFLTSLLRKYGRSVMSPKAHWYLSNCLLAPNRCPGSNIGGHKHAEVSGKPETEPFCWTLGVFFK